MIPWHDGKMIQLHNNTIGKWCNDTLIQRYIDTMIQWYIETMIHWYNDTTLPQWIDTMAQWCIRYNNTTVQKYKDARIQRNNDAAIQRYNNTIVKVTKIPLYENPRVFSRPSVWDIREILSMKLIMNLRKTQQRNDPTEQWFTQTNLTGFQILRCRECFSVKTIFNRPKSDCQNNIIRQNKK